MEPGEMRDLHQQMQRIAEKIEILGSRAVELKTELTCAKTRLDRACGVIRKLTENGHARWCLSVPLREGGSEDCDCGIHDGIRWLNNSK